MARGAPISAEHLQFELDWHNVFLCVNYVENLESLSLRASFPLLFPWLDLTELV